MAEGGTEGRVGARGGALGALAAGVVVVGCLLSEWWTESGWPVGLPCPRSGGERLVAPGVGQAALVQGALWLSGLCLGMALLLRAAERTTGAGPRAERAGPHAAQLLRRPATAGSEPGCSRAALWLRRRWRTGRGGAVGLEDATGCTRICGSAYGRAVRSGAVLLLLLSAGTLAVFGWAQARTRLLATDDLARVVPADPLDEGPIVRTRGLVLEQPAVAPRRGSMAAFDRRPPSWRFRMQAVEVCLSGGDWMPCEGTITVGFSAPAPGPAARPGAWIEATGRLGGFPPQLNPGGFDARAWARRERLSAALWLEGSDAISQVSPGSHLLEGRSPDDARGGELGSSVLASAAARIAGIRGLLRELAEEALLEDLPHGTPAEIRALLTAMFLGRREPALEELEGAFRRTGTVHLVAISGFNLAVLASAALLLARVGRAARRLPSAAQRRVGREVGREVGHEAGHERRGAGRDLASWAVIALVALYLFLVQDQPAVLRAGAMILVARLGEAFDRRWSAKGIYSAAAVILLLWRPADVANAGFQLSFAVVAGLIWLTPRLESQWFELSDRDGASLWSAARRLLLAAVAATAAAWLIAAPISLHHFGILSPLGGPLSLIAMPLASALLVVGYAKMLLTPVIPLASVVLGLPLAALAEALAGLVRMVDRLPGSVLHLPAPGAAWTLSMLAALVAAICADRPKPRRRLWFVVLLLALWPVRALVDGTDGPALRLDALAVGDGTCILLRSGGQTALFDAGSTNLSIGERAVVPALRALGVRRVDLLLISHANLDHFAAVLEITEEFPVGEVIVTPHFQTLAEAQPDGPAALLLRRLSTGGVATRLGGAGDSRTIGETRWRWLHPHVEDRPRRVNDSSQVVLVSAAGRGVLLCGDIELEALTLLRQREPQLRADVVELPHHGSWREESLQFVLERRPLVAIQSTGRRRALDPRWSCSLQGVQHFVTARDGAIHVEISADGAVDVWTHR